MNDLTVGIALGRLSTRGVCSVRVAGEWHAIIVSGFGDNPEKWVSVPDLFLLLQAEEVKV